TPSPVAVTQRGESAALAAAHECTKKAGSRPAEWRQHDPPCHTSRAAKGVSPRAAGYSSVGPAGCKSRERKCLRAERGPGRIGPGRATTLEKPVGPGGVFGSMLTPGSALAPTALD